MKCGIPPTTRVHIASSSHGLFWRAYSQHTTISEDLRAILFSTYCSHRPRNLHRRRRVEASTWRQCRSQKRFRKRTGRISMEVLGRCCSETNIEPRGELCIGKARHTNWGRRTGQTLAISWRWCPQSRQQGFHMMLA